MNKPHLSLTQFIEECPLYLKFGTDQPMGSADLHNLAFNFFCKHEKSIQPFRLMAVEQDKNDHHKPTNGSSLEFTEMFVGICQSCLNYKMTLVINGSSQSEKPKYFIRKIGQFPATEENVAGLPDEISFFLHEESRELYRKAVKDLDWQHGAGALTYFKKMIGREMDRIIAACSDPYAPDGNRINEAYLEFKHSGQKSKFFEDITPLLPKTLQTHGANCLLMLHEAASLGIEELSEAECCNKAKDIDTLFRYLLKKIYAERTDNYAEKPPGKYFLRYS